MFDFYSSYVYVVLVEKKTKIIQFINALKIISWVMF